MRLCVRHSFVLMTASCLAFVVAAGEWEANPEGVATQPLRPPVAAARAGSSRASLRLPEVPFRYATPDLPVHFRTSAAQLFDNTPRDNVTTDWGATLGRAIFYDTRLSDNGTVSCGSCHVQRHAFDDPSRFSRGFKGLRTDRHAMNLVGLRYHPRGRFFWDERGATLETMVLLPVQNRLEMGRNPEDLPAIFTSDPQYPGLFERAFGDRTITTDRIARALAQFIRSLVSYQSKYDAGRAAASAVADDFPGFTLQENRGKALFLRNCAACHLPAQQDAHFVMTEPVSTGLDADARTTDGGVGDITLVPGDLGRFKSPSLRNVEVSAPYMHDGRFDSLEAVLDHYSTGGAEHPNRDIRIQPLRFTDSEKAALVAFLKTLTDRAFLEDPKFSDPYQ